LQDLQEWFPSINIKSFPKDSIEISEIEKIKQSLSFMDYILMNEDKHPIKQEIQKISKEKFPQKSFFFKATTCAKADPKISLIDPQKSMVENLVDFCKNQLGIKEVFSSNGIVSIKGINFQKFPQRVCIHPTSNDVERNWPKEKFFALAKKLKQQKFSPSFLTAAFERKEWLWVEEEGFDLPKIFSLDEMASYIYESGFFIGNDSGVGHLASSLKIPTLTIFTTKRKEKLWRPSFGKSMTIYPLPFLPNFKNFRWRDQYWEKGISVNRVFRKFCSLTKEFVK
jgi:ADP-heptose:LPS heptosyltransferase